jgi:hypothetical protein
MGEFLAEPEAVRRGIGFRKEERQDSFRPKRSRAQRSHHAAVYASGDSHYHAFAPELAQYNVANCGGNAIALRRCIYIQQIGTGCTW